MKPVIPRQNHGSFAVIPPTVRDGFGRGGFQGGRFN